MRQEESPVTTQLSPQPLDKFIESVASARYVFIYTTRQNYNDGHRFFNLDSGGFHLTNNAWCFFFNDKAVGSYPVTLVQQRAADHQGYPRQVRRRGTGTASPSRGPRWALGSTLRRVSAKPRTNGRRRSIP